MKKLVVFSVCTFAFSIFPFCQTSLLYQNFDASTTSMPPGWHQQLPSSDPTNHGWQFNNAFPAVGLWNDMPITSYCAFVADTIYNTTMVQNYDTLYSPVINCVGHRLVYMSENHIFGYENPDETINVALSNDSGKTWTNEGQLGGRFYYWDDSVLGDISAKAAGKPNVMIAFCYQDGCNSSPERGFGVALDNIDVYDPDDSLYDIYGWYLGVPYLMQVGSSDTVYGGFINEGIDTITSVTINYIVNGGTPVPYNITGIHNFYHGHFASFKSKVPFVPTYPGNYTVKTYCTNLNGSHQDQVHSNDTIITHFTVADTIQNRQVLLEEFTQAGCGPCLLLEPTIDTVLANNVSRCHAIRYHHTYPGIDYMDAVTKYFIVPRADYYYGWRSGVPYAIMDGLDVPTDSFGISTKYIDQEVAMGSPFSIKINSFMYNPVTDSMVVDADIKAYSDIPTTIFAQAVVTLDTINYHEYQDPIFLDFMAPPLGTGIWPDGDTIYMQRFEQVAEDMMPTSNGTALAPFTTGQTQHLQVGWTKNHPWSLTPSVYPYDSSNFSVTVFVQDTNTTSITGVVYKSYVYQCATAHATIDFSTAGKNINQKEGNVFVYPNPGKGVFTIQLSAPSTRGWTVEVYNVLGEQVYSSGYPPSTNHYSLDLSSNPNGIYLYRVIANIGNILGEGKLVIQK